MFLASNAKCVHNIIVLYTLCMYFMNQNYIICDVKEINSPPVLKIDKDHRHLEGS